MSLSILMPRGKSQWKTPTQFKQGKWLRPFGNGGLGHPPHEAKNHKLSACGGHGKCLLGREEGTGKHRLRPLQKRGLRPSCVSSSFRGTDFREAARAVTEPGKGCRVGLRLETRKELTVRLEPSCRQTSLFRREGQSSPIFN